MPDFIIIGGQRCGTTSLYSYLIEHPLIAPAAEKELHFFDLNFDKGVEWYESQFTPASQPQVLTGEASPYYIFHPLVPQRLHQLYPQVKPIALLRDPVDRAISHYYHEVRLGFESLTLEEAIASEAARLEGEAAKIIADPNYHSFNHRHYSYLSRGIYIQQLRHWMQYFPREQFLILKSEDFYANPAAIVSQVFQFLNLPIYQQGQYSKYNRGDYPVSSLDKHLRQMLEKYFQPYNQQLASYLGRTFWEYMTEAPQIDYEGAWDAYAQSWQSTGQAYIGDEWNGKNAGAAQDLAEYEALIEQQAIAPYINKADTVLEIGVGGGKTAALLLKHCQQLVCADISSQMLQATRKRLGDENISYIKLDGLSLNNIAPGTIDVCFCYDTMVHMEPRDIYNYLTQIPRLMREKRLCIFHHSNILTPLGWQKFLNDYPRNLLGRRDGTAFSVMTDGIVEKFLTHLNYEIIRKETELVPRDCIWICRAPIVSAPQQVLPELVQSTAIDLEPIASAPKQVLPELASNNLIREISPNDAMYAGNDRHYFSVGQSALKAIELALKAAGKEEVNKILDLPCGHGRVLRTLKSAFPKAQLTACDLDKDGVDFCARVFDATAVYSKQQPEQIKIDSNFDLIWSGSLLTHLSAPSWTGFLKLFNALLNPGGVLVFTTQGRRPVQLIRENQYTYGLEPNQLPRLLNDYEQKGFGYLDYPDSNDYGISLASPAWVCSQLEHLPSLRLLLYSEMPWDNHQDVVACVRV